MDHSTIKLNDERLKFMTALDASNYDTYYELPFEPDGHYLKVWYMLDHLGARMRDMSMLDNHANVSGHPTLRRANLDLGFQQSSSVSEGGEESGTPVMLFNTGTDLVSQIDGEYIWIPDNSNIRFTEFTQDTSGAFSIACRFNCLEFEQHDTASGGTYLRRIASKADDENNGWNLVVSQAGSLIFQVIHDGVDYQRRITGHQLDTWYQVVVTYDPDAGPTAEDRIKMYTDGVEQSQSANTVLFIPTTFNLRIGARSSGSGFFRGYIHDFRLYGDKVLTQQEITNLNTNEITIENIAKGRVFIVQYALVGTPLVMKTHVFDRDGKVRRVRYHKWITLEKLTVTRTHIYEVTIPMAAPRTRTHKYSVLGLVKIIQIHAYNVDGRPFRESRHRYHMDGHLVVTKTHIYDVGEGEIITQVVRFQKNSSGTNGITQDVNLNFTPRAIILFSDGSTANNSTSAHMQIIQGYSDGTNHACIAATASDNANFLLSNRKIKIHRNDSVFVRQDVENSAGSTTLSRATCSFSLNKVTFTWVVNDTAATYIEMLAIGGDGVTNAKVNTVEVGTATTGNKDYTGLGFSPDITDGKTILFTMNHSSDSINSASTQHCFGSGCAVSSSKRWALSNVSDYNGTNNDTTAYRYYSDNKCLIATNQNAGQTSNQILFAADFVSWITDGFRLNYTTAPSGSTLKFSYLVIKGGTWDAGTLTAPTTITNNVDYTVAANSLPIKGLFMQGNANVTTTVNTLNITHNMITCGISDGTNQATIGMFDEDNLIPTSDSYRVNNNTQIARCLSPTGTDTDIAVFDSFGTNSFRLDWPTKTVNAQLYGWVGLANIVSVAGTSTVSTTKTHKWDVTGGTAPVLTQVIRVQKTATSSNGATQDVTFNFTPKAIIVWSAGETQTAIMTTYFVNVLGFSDGTNDASTCIIGEHGQSTTDSRRGHRSDSVFHLLSTSTNDIVMRASVTFSSNTVTLTWDLNSADQPYLNILALGGDDITNAKVNTVQVARSSTGTQDYTGLGFTPVSGESVLFLLNSAMVSADVNDLQPHGNSGFGAAVSSSKRFAISNNIEDSLPASESFSHFYNNKCFVQANTTSGSAIESHADFSAWITDGFRLNWTDAPSSSTNLMSYLVIKGGVWDVGSTVSPSAADSQTVSSLATNSKPIRALIVVGDGKTTQNTSSSDACISFAATDGTNEYSAATFDDDGQDLTISYRYGQTGLMYDKITNISTHEGVAVFTSFGTNQFTLNWTASNAARNFGYIVVADKT